MKKNCKHCQISFNVIPSRDKTATFCSKSCGALFANKNRKYNNKLQKEYVKCTKCKQIKSKDNFYKKQYWCKDCFKSLIRNNYLQRLYKISSNDYDDLLEAQNFGCAICGKKDDTYLPLHNHSKMLAVDHCHKTNTIRGLLCENCNRGLGLFKDNKNLLKQAIEYLNQF